jgi:GT2 family glycosyltransferase
MTVSPSKTAPPKKVGAKISVITVSYETGPILLESITATLADPDIAELIIVDNGNPQTLRAELAALIGQDDRLRLFQGHGNIGFARACNYGARQAIGDYLLFLNPDAILPPGAARALAEVGAEVDEEVGAGRATPWISGGRLMGADGQEQRGARRGRLTFGSAFSSFTPLHRLPGFVSLHWEDRPLPDAPVEVPTISGALMMMPRSAFESLGGFDPAYFLHVEDIALCRTVREAGGSVIFVPTVEVLHYGSTSNAPRLTVEAHKLRGFLRYFWTSGGPFGGMGAKLGTIIGAPLMAAAILGRAVWLSWRR